MHVIYILIFACLLGGGESEALSIIKSNQHGGRSVGGVHSRGVSPANRTLCPESDFPRPPNRVDTRERIAALRAAMNDTTLTGGTAVHAYLIFISDDHGTAGSDWDARVNYISGFSGSNGFIIVTQDHFALWTDGRYYLQAENQLECNLILMKSEEPDYPTGPGWLTKVLASGNRVGAYPNYVSIDVWQTYETELNAADIHMVAIPGQDLVDRIWTDASRPAKPNNPVFIHNITFAGRIWQDKIADIRAEMLKPNASVLIVHVLEEVNWLFNLRGSDRTSSLFYGYAIIEPNAARLYVVNLTKITVEVRQHLNSTSCPPGGAMNCVNLHEYSSITEDITALPPDARIWVDPTASFAIYSAALNSHVIKPLVTSPILLIKSIKNEVEQRNFFNCIMRDSAYVVEYAAFIEKEIADGHYWTEITGSDKLYSIRNQDDNFKGLSFETIAAVGPNAAVIHYRATNDTDAQITDKDVYLLDSGGQYLDGTTDVTRTFHFGTPKEIEKEAYTRVLMGAIDLAMTVWPEGLYGRDIDARARAPLWQNGWDYNHGTGHGIGYFMSVHEGPGRINIGYVPTQAPLYEGMFFSDEPGYYQDGEFGIRLETLVGIVEADTPHKFGGRKYLGFRPATLVPFEPKLIIYDRLSQAQINWLVEYNKLCLDQVGVYVRDTLKNQEAYDWMVARMQTSLVSSGYRIHSPGAMISLTIVIMTALKTILF